MKLIYLKKIICSLLLLLSTYSFAQDTIWNHLLQKNVTPPPVFITEISTADKADQQNTEMVINRKVIF